MSRSQRILEHAFLQAYRERPRRPLIARSALAASARALGVSLPKNQGDMIYAVRHGRSALPPAVRELAPRGREWVIEQCAAGYRFIPRRTLALPDPESLRVTRLPDATPAAMLWHGTGDEQHLLARVRANRLIDHFTGTVAWSLQTHLRTGVPQVGQVEVDELYVGYARGRRDAIIPVQAKCGAEGLAQAQIRQDLHFCAHHHPGLRPLPVGITAHAEDLVLLAFALDAHGELQVQRSARYRLHR